MKYLKNILNKKELVIVAVFVLISAFLHLRQIDFPCINSDEASFAYNALSISETARDEYGSFLPTRFLAFGENKLPVTIYSIVPFVSLFGLNDIASRLPFILIGIISPALFYFLIKRLLNNNSVALIAAFLTGISPWIQILSRHIHEDTIILAIAIGMVILIAKLHDQFKIQTIVTLATLSGIGLFTYHIGKFLAVFALGWVIFLSMRQKITLKSAAKYTFILFVPILIFFATELMHPSSRVGNLLFTSDQGFTLKIEELRKEHDARILHNKLTQSISVITNQYLSYFSPEFLVTKGDANLRFGASEISPITPIEYVFVFIGIYFFFKRQEKYRYLIMSLFLTAPLTATLSWQTQSLTRSYLMIIPLIISSSYGLYHSINNLNKYRIITSVILIGGILYFAFFSWDYYFNHYQNQPDVQSAWQCGYKELATEIKANYDSYDQIIVTKKRGQPYIFMLYYLGYSPQKYQEQAELSEPDEYGFGQVETFDKFHFTFSSPHPNKKNTLYIGTPDDFEGTGISQSDVKILSSKSKEVFWIYPKSTK